MVFRFDNIEPYTEGGKIIARIPAHFGLQLAILKLKNAGCLLGASPIGGLWLHRTAPLGKSRRFFAEPCRLRLQEVKLAEPSGWHVGTA